MAYHNKLWKILKEMGIPDHLTCLLRNLYAGQEATVRTRHGTMDWFKLGKEYIKAVHCHPAYLTYMQSTLCEIPSWMSHRLESRLPEVTTTLDVQMIPAESKDELKSLLMEVKQESEKVDLKLNIQKTKIVATDPITSCQKDGDTMVKVSDFIFLGSKITADGDCSHEIKTCLLLGRKVMTNLAAAAAAKSLQSCPTL